MDAAAWTVSCSTLSSLKRRGFIPELCVGRRVTLPGVPACPVSSAAVPAALCGDRGSHRLGILSRSVAATFLYVHRKNRKVYWYVTWLNDETDSINVAQGES